MYFSKTVCIPSSTTIFPVTVLSYTGKAAVSVEMSSSSSKLWKDSFDCSPNSSGSSTIFAIFGAGVALEDDAFLFLEDTRCACAGVKIYRQWIRKFYGWGRFLPASEGHIYRYSLFSEELPRTRHNHRLHFSIPCEGFGKGMNTFFPDFSISFSDFGHLSGYLESVLYSPQQQCLVLTIFTLLGSVKYGIPDLYVSLCLHYGFPAYISLQRSPMFVWVTRGVSWDVIYL